MDVALYSHPEFIDTVSLASRWMRREHVHLFGARSLTGELEPPLRAAQAILAANALDMMVENITLDGDVEDGTSLALQADLLVFADTEAELEAGCKTARATVPDGTWTSGVTYRGVRNNPSVTAAVAEAFAAAGRGFEPNPPPLPFATDFGNISQRVPAALIGVGPHRRLVVPHRRGRPAVRVGGRRRRRDDHRARARAQRGSAHRARKLDPHAGHHGAQLPGTDGIGASCARDKPPSRLGAATGCNPATGARIKERPEVPVLDPINLDAAAEQGIAPAVAAVGLARRYGQGATVR